VLGYNLGTVFSIVFAIVGFCVSYFLGDVKNNVAKLKKMFKKENN